MAHALCMQQKEGCRHGNNSFADAPEYYVMLRPTLSVLFCFIATLNEKLRRKYIYV